QMDRSLQEAREADSTSYFAPPAGPCLPFKSLFMFPCYDSAGGSERHNGRHPSNPGPLQDPGIGGVRLEYTMRGRIYHVQRQFEIIVSSPGIYMEAQGLRTAFGETERRPSPAVRPLIHLA